MSYAQIDELVEETRSRQARPLAPRERITAGAMAAAFLAVAVPLAAHAAPGAARLPAILLFTALYAAASVVEFEVGTGAAVPTQLVLVPMLFVLPLGVVPLVAACAFVAGDLVRAAFRTGERAVPLTLIGS